MSADQFNFRLQVCDQFLVRTKYIPLLHKNPFLLEVIKMNSITKV